MANQRYKLRAQVSGANLGDIEHTSNVGAPLRDSYWELNTHGTVRQIVVAQVHFNPCAHFRSTLYSIGLRSSSITRYPHHKDPHIKRY